MELSSAQHINLPIVEVWAALNDPEILKRCIPQCESVERISEREFRVSMMAAIGPVRAKFTAKLKYTNLDAPHSCSMIFDGQGGAAGFGKGEAQLTLTPEGNATLLGYQVNAQIGGKLAQIGSRLVDAAARKMADDFFSKFNNVVLVARAAETAETPMPVAIDEAKDAPGEKSRYWRRWLVWLFGTLIIGALVNEILR